MRRKLKTHDHHIWEKVARTVTPLEKQRRKAEGEVTFALEMADDKQLKSISAPTNKISAPSAPRKIHAPLPVPQSQAVEHAREIEKPQHRKIAKGRLPIDARIDLHDCTQDIAYKRLLSFIESAALHEMRHVLIITGKGNSSGGSGILRRMVPLWLSTKPMADLVNGVSLSAQNHGGEGALYVRLRKKAKR